MAKWMEKSSNYKLFTFKICMKNIDSWRSELSETARWFKQMNEYAETEFSLKNLAPVVAAESEAKVKAGDGEAQTDAKVQSKTPSTVHSAIEAGEDVKVWGMCCVAERSEITADAAHKGIADCEENVEYIMPSGKLHTKPLAETVAKPGKGARDAMFSYKYTVKCGHSLSLEEKKSLTLSGGLGIGKHSSTDLTMCEFKDRVQTGGLEITRDVLPEVDAFKNFTMSDGQIINLFWTSIFTMRMCSVNEQLWQNKLRRTHQFLQKLLI